jgi:tetratricopeptide (TPR) repeat protein
MFLKKLFRFKKDYSHYLEKGDRYFSEDRFADARDAYGEALERITGNEGENPTLLESIRSKHQCAGDRLALLNLEEAQHAVRGGELGKAGEHLRLVLELTVDMGLRKKAGELLENLESGKEKSVPIQKNHSCTSCKGGEGESEHDQHGMDEKIQMDDRIELYFHSLPEDMPGRYRAMGEKFARGYMLNLEGNPQGALKIYEELSAEQDNDILDYEKAIIYYHGGETDKCEKLLLKGLDLNALNPLCYIALVHLYVDTGRASKAVPVLDRMLSNDLIPDQARLMMGDVLTMLQDEKSAIEYYSQILSSPKFAAEAAGRLIPLLESHGRSQEAAYLAKKFAKGCC